MLDCDVSTTILFGFFDSVLELIELLVADVVVVVVVDVVVADVVLMELDTLQISKRKTISNFTFIRNV